MFCLVIGISPDGWINRNGTNECYLFAKDGPGVSWFQARDYCNSVGGSLADNFNKKTQDFLKKYHDPNIFWWLGGHLSSKVSIYYYNLQEETPNYLFYNMTSLCI